ncbi:NAD(P)/FAD-dependent oxidoreductase [Amycolatopsis sp. H20-H5]|uniref:NAD(P)/FAD-dependent oxidoreductase n=1 Tax=Amycolatopsis sp. H20-H5 TaxID=3046309 RepID=UPI002DB8BB87|nr:FAD-binding oxidoreductase [Amycolatopsis sp. H20-H5]MEC3981173.1 FAD-binding oxidoreductase [Amycolatopsis sp. H20-H5]
MRVLVIGTGIAGTSTAFHLARRGVEVVLLARDQPGKATAAGAGIVSPWTTRRDEDEYRLAVKGAAHYREIVRLLAEEGETGTSFEVMGGMMVSADDTELAGLETKLRDRAVADPLAGAVTRLDSAQARELFPPLAPDLRAVHVEGSGRVDGRRLSAALLASATSRTTTRLVNGDAKLLLRGGRVAGAEIPGETIEADVVVVATGAWTEELLAPLGVSSGVNPSRGQITHLGLPGVDTARWPVVLPPSSHYLLAFGDSRVVAGATRETGTGFDHRVTAAGQREVLEHALAVAPGLADATLLETRVGFRPATADGLPVIGAVPGHPELLLATGFGPAGLTIGPYTGSLVAGLALGEPSEFDLGAYGVGRFSPR